MAVDTTQLTFEEAMRQLEEIVNKLQNGNISLEDSMEAFQDGMTLSHFCGQKLEHAEETMTQLINEDGSISILDDNQVNE